MSLLGFLCRKQHFTFCVHGVLFCVQNWTDKVHFVQLSGIVYILITNVPKRELWEWNYIPSLDSVKFQKQSQEFLTIFVVTVIVVFVVVVVVGAVAICVDDVTHTLERDRLIVWNQLLQFK